MKKIVQIHLRKRKYFLIFIFNLFSRIIVADCPDTVSTVQCCFEINTTLQEQNKILQQFLIKKDTCCSQTIINNNYEKPCNCEPDPNGKWGFWEELGILFFKIVLFPFLLAWATKKWLKKEKEIKYLTLFAIYYAGIVIWTLVSNIHINYSSSAHESVKDVPAFGTPWWAYIADIITALTTITLAIIAWVQLSKLSFSYRNNASMEIYKLIADGLNWLREDRYNIVSIENAIKESFGNRMVAEHPYNKATSLLLKFEELFDLANKSLEDKEELIEKIQFLYRVLYRDRFTKIQKQSIVFKQYNQENSNIMIVVDFMFAFTRVNGKLGLHN